MAIKLVVYDLDGTLVDTAPLAVSILNNLRKERGLPTKSIYELKHLLSLGGGALIVHGLDLNPDEDVDFWVKRFRNVYKEQPGDSSPLYNYVLETLAELVSKKVKVAICTNKPRFLTEPILQAHGLDKFISKIIAGDDLPTKKPDPENLLSCLSDEQLSEVIFVGDSSVDQKTAKNAGIKFAFFTRGYDDGVIQPAADFVSNSHDTIKEFILKNA